MKEQDVQRGAIVKQQNYPATVVQQVNRFRDAKGRLLGGWMYLGCRPGGYDLQTCCRYLRLIKRAP